MAPAATTRRARAAIEYAGMPVLVSASREEPAVAESSGSAGATGVGLGATSPGTRSRRTLDSSSSSPAAAKLIATSASVATVLVTRASKEPSAAPVTAPTPKAVAESGTLRQPDERRFGERVEEQLQLTLGADGYTAATREGAGLSLDAAVALAARI